jgi:DNA-binding XRE family transcriptional regulator
MFVGTWSSNDSPPQLNPTQPSLGRCDMTDLASNPQRGKKELRLMKNEPDYENLSVFKQAKTALKQSLAHGRGDLALKTTTLPPMPPRRANGDYPAIQAARVSIARDIIRARRAAGLTQAEPARRARIRVETLNRIEKAKVTADVATTEKIDKGLAG